MPLIFDCGDLLADGLTADAEVRSDRAGRHAGTGTEIGHHLSCGYDIFEA
ncbi:MAG: hypothetical protein IKY57_08030 [Alistipes sp.]|nr:hypothetical protein [Alistipes sp.]